MNGQPTIQLFVCVLAFHSNAHLRRNQLNGPEHEMGCGSYWSRAGLICTAQLRKTEHGRRMDACCEEFTRKRGAIPARRHRHRRPLVDPNFRWAPNFRRTAHRRDRARRRACLGNAVWIDRPPNEPRTTIRRDRQEFAPRSHSRNRCLGACASCRASTPRGSA